MFRRLFIGSLVAVCVATVFQIAERDGEAQGRPRYPTEEQLAQSEEAQESIAAALAAAGSDLIPEFEHTCTTMGPQRPAVNRQLAGLPPDPTRTIEPMQIFDNLYYFGFNTVGAWAIPTSDGIILIDSLSSSEQVVEILLPGMREMGLDPEQIKYVVLSHGHPGQTDHIGGAGYLERTFGASVLMGAADWENITQPVEPGMPLQATYLPRHTSNTDVTDSRQLTLGDTTLTLVSTPGHTPGTLGFLIPVQHRGVEHTILFLGGVLQTPDRESFLALEQVLGNLARQGKAETVFNGHPGIFLGQSLEVMQSVGRLEPNDPNPLLYGVERFDRYLSLMIECSRARIVALESN